MGLPILCLDFDGVLHSYASGWKGAHIIPDPPIGQYVDRDDAVAARDFVLSKLRRELAPRPMPVGFDPLMLPPKTRRFLIGIGCWYPSTPDPPHPARSWKAGRVTG